MFVRFDRNNLVIVKVLARSRIKITTVCMCNMILYCFLPVYNISNLELLDSGD